MSLVLVIGGGGREHAIACSLSQSKGVRAVHAVPGNPGMGDEAKVHCVTLDIANHQAVVDYCRREGVALVAVGPEAPLADGLSDSLTKAKFKVFGPSYRAAALEYDKAAAKAFMLRHAIPTARSHSFQDPAKAKAFISTSGWGGWAVKAAGLAGGKGVIVTSDRQEALAAVDELTTSYSQAARTLVIEERLYGEEISAMCFSDGKTIAMMPPAQDHKTRFAGDTGPNTGGMGAVCPRPVSSDIAVACEDILKKTVDGMVKEGNPFIGVLYAGLMVCAGRPYVLEYNCRFGDPETQAVLSLLQSDLYSTMQTCVSGRLSQKTTVQFASDRSSCAVVVVTKDYPASAHKGLPITGLDSISSTSDCCVKVYHSSTARRESDGVLCTNGGRVVTVVATAADAAVARTTALQQAKLVSFEGASVREDIGLKAAILLEGPSTAAQPVHTYLDSGVDVALGERFVESIRESVAATQGPQVLEGIGGFGALYDLGSSGFKDPVLVSGTDGVGTKLMIANAMGRHDTIGQDLVAMCLNDILCHGAQPLFFLDYLATGRLELHTMEAVIKGIARACKETHTALVGGETAEMPGLYRPGEYDLAGFAVGAVERSSLLPRRDLMADGDVLVGLASAGLHSNGYSLVRRVVEDLQLEYTDPCPFDSSRTLGEVLLTPTRLYRGAFTRVQKHVLGAAHITGGGLVGNAARMLPAHLSVQLDVTKWHVQDEFLWLASHGVSAKELSLTFNMGLGLILVVRKGVEALVLSMLQKEGASVVGRLKKGSEGEPRVSIANLESHVGSLVQQFRTTRLPVLPSLGQPPRVRVAILISGRGSNMQAIVRASQSDSSPMSVVLVLSNRPDAEGLAWAHSQGIKTACVNHRAFKDRESFEEVMHQHLVQDSVQLVCLAGFMRILTGAFVSRWKDRLINIHPSILPSFKGKDAQKQALEAKVKLTGCTVHFVEVDVDSGAILEQQSVPVLPHDTEASLSERIREAEHVIFPRAVLSVAKSLLETAASS